MCVNVVTVSIACTYRNSFPSHPRVRIHIRHSESAAQMSLRYLPPTPREHQTFLSRDQTVKHSNPFANLH